MADSNLIDLSESTRKSIESNFPDYMFESYEECKASPQDPRVLKLQLIDAQSHKFNLLKEELTCNLKNEFQSFKDKLTLELTEVFRINQMEIRDILQLNKGIGTPSKPRDTTVCINQTMPFKEEGEIRIKFMYPQQRSEAPAEGTAL
jgi:hypothetical protein